MSAGHRQRLKDRFMAGATRALTDVALLELLLTYAIPQKDVQPLAEQLITQFGSLDKVLAADVTALKGVPGVGDAAATLLKLTASLVTRRESMLNPRTPGDAAYPPTEPSVDEAPEAASCHDEPV